MTHIEMVKIIIILNFIHESDIVYKNVFVIVYTKYPKMKVRIGP